MYNLDPRTFKEINEANDNLINLVGGNMNKLKRSFLKILSKIGKSQEKRAIEMLKSQGYPVKRMSSCN